MPLPQQQLALMPVQLRYEPALPCPFDDLQGLVQQGQGLFNLSCELTCCGEEGDRMGQIPLRPGGAVSGRPTAQKRHSLGHVAILDRDPTAIDRSQCTPVGETLLGRHRNQLVCPLIQGCIFSDKRKQPGSARQVPSQRRQMSEPASLSDRRAALCQCLVRKAETKKKNPRTALVMLRAGELRLDGQGIGERLDHKALAPLRDANGITQTCRQP